MIAETLDLPRIVYRGYRREDADFFYRAWLDSYGLASPVTVNIPKSIYFREQRRLIDQLLDRLHSRLVVASLDCDSAVVIGFLLAEMLETPIIHYIYVKGQFRRMGIAKGLLDQLGIDPASPCIYSHQTYETTWLRAKWPKAKYNPYLAFGDQYGS